MAIQLLTEPSIIQEGRALFTVDGCEPFILHVKTFNYFNFIRPSCVKQITYDIDTNIVTILLDQVAIRHCHDRWLTINMQTKEFLWHEALSDMSVETIPVEKDAMFFNFKAKNA